MAIVTPTNLSVKQLKGLHLYHADISNCSMRVRIALAEKGLPWTSHHIDLRKKENVTPEYFGIHPKGLVPTLVHDGVVHVESNEIIEYLDGRFPNTPLQPASDPERKEVQEWLHVATDIHIRAVKTLIYTRKMRPQLRKDNAEHAKYRSLQRDPELLAFHSKVASEGGIGKSEVDAAEQTLLRCFEKADAALGRHEWLVGDRFSLADIAWAPLHFTLVGVKFPFERYPRVEAWAEAVRQRPSFRDGVLRWCEKF